ncbi:MAG: hypothetical protein GX595_12740 [Lentisphaerae bacterium]|nr:hypothetical protein [Lentisphaerota bacterium]
MTTSDTSKSLIEIASEPSLNHAWKQVALKHGAAGIDHVTVEQFAQRLGDEVRQLSDEMVAGSYQPRPLVVFHKPKDDGGFREITVGTIRDRVAARSAAEHLDRLVEPRLQPQSYAYRHGKGAMRAVALTQEACRQSAQVVRVDIRSFFDSIDHGRLEALLRGIGLPDDVHRLVLAFARNARFDGVSLVQPARGIPQGSPLAPVLANLYLDPLDRALVDAGVRFLRYADDLIAFAASPSEAAAILSRICFELTALSLEPSLEKSRVHDLDDGVPFLGFVFQRHSHSAGPEARERLHSKLCERPYDDETPEAFERRLGAVRRGWNNYFNPSAAAAATATSAGTARAATAATAAGTPRAAAAAVDPGRRPAAVAAAVADADDSPAEYGVTDRRPAALATEPPAGGMPVDSPDEASPATAPADAARPDVALRLETLREWLQAGRAGEAAHGLRRLLNDDSDDLAEATRNDALRLLAEAYRSQGLHGAAAACLRHAGVADSHPAAPPDDAAEVPFASRDVETWMDLFAHGAGQVYAQYVDGTGRSGYRPLAPTLTPELLHDHWRGEQTLAVSIHGDDQQVHFAVVDLDINRAELDRGEAQHLADLRERLLDDARHLQDTARRAGVESLIEFSGCKGYHLWFLFHQPLDASLAVAFLQELTRVAGPVCTGAHRELFPAAAAPSADGANARIKLPCGLHRVTGRRACLVGPDGEPCRMQLQTLGLHSVRATAAALRNAIRIWTRFSSPVPADPGAASAAAAGPAGDVAVVMNRCSVLAALERKAGETKSLTHYERLVIRGVLDPLGPAGHQAIHAILGHCDNYSRRVTEGFLGRPGIQPMGCSRIREILGTFCAEVGCSCRFAPRKADYAHPLRHLQRPAATPPRTAAASSARPAAPAATPGGTAVRRGSASGSAAPTATPEPRTSTPDPAAPADDDLRQAIADYSRLRTEILRAQERLEAALGPDGTLALDLGVLTREPADPELHRWLIRL